MPLKVVALNCHLLWDLALPSQVKTKVLVFIDQITERWRGSQLSLKRSELCWKTCLRYT